MYILSLETDNVYGELNDQFGLKRFIAHKNPKLDRSWSKKKIAPFVRDMFFADLADSSIEIFAFGHNEHYFMSNERDYDPVMLKLSLPAGYRIAQVVHLEEDQIFVDYYMHVIASIEKFPGDDDALQNALFQFWTDERLAKFHRVL